jgi:hypothetical protein
MWYAYEGDAGISGLVPLTPERVKEIAELNASGEKPKELLEFVAEIKEPDYSNVVGQDSLNRFEHVFKAKKKNKRGGGKSQKQTEAVSAVAPQSKGNEKGKKRFHGKGGNKDRNNKNESKN